MAGGGSGDNGRQVQKLDIPIEDRIAFAGSAEAQKKYTAEDFNNLNNAKLVTNGGGYWSGNGQTNITGLVNDFNAWKITQDNLKAGFNQYAVLANSQEGRDANILGGAQASPNVPTQILGTPNPLASPVSEPALLPKTNISRRAGS